MSILASLDLPAYDVTQPCVNPAIIGATTTRIPANDRIHMASLDGVVRHMVLSLAEKFHLFTVSFCADDVLAHIGFTDSM